MENLKEIWDELKNRSTNPLIISFVVAWIVFNWEIPLILLFYKHEEVLYDGYLSYIDAVRKNTNFDKNFYCPLAFALGYTLLFPPFMSVIKVINEWVLAIRDTKILHVTKNSKVPVSKYIDLIDVYKGKTDKIEELVAKEGETFTKLGALQTKFVTLESENRELRSDLSTWQNTAEQFRLELENSREVLEMTKVNANSASENVEKLDKLNFNWLKYNHPSIIDGKWSVKINLQDGGTATTTRDLSNGTLYDNRIAVGKISKIIGNPNTKEIFFILSFKSPNERVPDESYILRFLETEKVTLKGTRNMAETVVFEKVI